MKLPYDLAVPLLGIYPKEIKTPERNLQSYFIVTLFTIVKI